MDDVQYTEAKSIDNNKSDSNKKLICQESSKGDGSGQLSSLNGSLKLFLEGTSIKSSSSPKEETSGESTLQPISQVFNRLRLQEVPLDMLHCSEIVERNDQVNNIISSTPHPSINRRAQFWSLSNASCPQDMNEAESMWNTIRVAPIESDLQDVLDLVQYSNESWNAVSGVVEEEMSSIRMFETAVESNKSSENFEGFENKKDELLKHRECFRKVVNFARECKMKYRQIKKNLAPLACNIRRSHP